ncbi:hypothetical protein QTN47_25480 [Danxiaibacter flavus]|uniref:Uncharacterized protein n=1 Tax=Danxiaibacter flavus TaxID=3049108 RepID=A0ABV3ZP05_9BACT|nr:hypothetical protein QNM32_25485 [Chitinophagaceae bacterium DXS]
MTRAKSLKYLAVGLAMTSVCIWSIKDDFWFGWVGLIFFGVINLMFLIKIINPKFKWVNDTDINSQAFTDITKTDFNKLYNDNGIFTYFDNGFAVKTKKGDKTIEWTQISKLTGYKRDYFTTDCICLVVEYGDNQNFEITEEHSGWFQFLEHLKQAFPSIDKSWEIEISTPAFATNLTVLYDRANRNDIQ